MSKKKRKNKTCEYVEMVLDLSRFVRHVATKDNPAPSETNAMVEVAKLLFRTV